MMHATIDIADVRLTDGTRLSYATAGPLDGTPVVLLHGLSDSWHSFSLLLSDLPPGIRAIAPSHRGHGDSDRPRAGYAPDELAADVVGVLDALGVDRAVVVGHSLGAAVALRFAVASPERLSGLVLAGAFATPMGQNPEVAELMKVVDMLHDPVDPEFIREFQYSTLATPMAESFMDAVLAESAKVPAHAWQAVMRGLVASDPVEGADRIAAPTLVIWGDQDAFVPRADQDVLLALISECSLRVYEGIGHAVHWEAPARFGADLARFVAGVTG